MFNIDIKSKIPIYEQIYNQTKNLILKGVLAEDDKIPSVRELAMTLTINPNTIQKAYRQLEADGYIYVVRGRGNFVNAIGEQLRKQEIEDVSIQLKAVIKEAKLLGVDETKLIDIIKASYKEE